MKLMKIVIAEIYILSIKVNVLSEHDKYQEQFEKT